MVPACPLPEDERGNLGAICNSLSSCIAGMPPLKLPLLFPSCRLGAEKLSSWRNGDRWRAGGRKGLASEEGAVEKVEYSGTREAMRKVEPVEEGYICELDHAAEVPVERDREWLDEKGE